jgi:tetratricopeptide (TPR) repeat protein
LLGQAKQKFQMALACYREVGNRAGEVFSLNNSGFIYERLGQYAEALDYYQQAIDVLKSLRATVGSEESWAAFIAQYAGLYHRAVFLYHAQRQDTQVFYTAEWVLSITRRRQCRDGDGAQQVNVVVAPTHRVCLRFTA